MAMQKLLYSEEILTDEDIRIALSNETVPNPCHNPNNSQHHYPNQIFVNQTHQVGPFMEEPFSYFQYQFPLPNKPCGFAYPIYGEAVPETMVYNNETMVYNNETMVNNNETMVYNNEPMVYNNEPMVYNPTMVNYYEPMVNNPTVLSHYGPMVSNPPVVVNYSEGMVNHPNMVSYYAGMVNDPTIVNSYEAMVDNPTMYGTWGQTNTIYQEPTSHETRDSFLCPSCGMVFVHHETHLMCHCEANKRFESNTEVIQKSELLTRL